MLSCSNQTFNEAGLMQMEGIVAKISNNEILVVEGVTSDEINGLSEQEIIEHSNEATYFTLLEDNNSIDDLMVGNSIRVWFEALNLSKPASGIGSHIEILD
ncbi:YobA family protein [Alkalihalobacillus sp. 1P02AB]|uniref:YobA family protein n=1 Tax=Alkalihalobacillus sp. 1P02AB TaxID=3132260 RepID=UPI0039A419BC